MSYGVSGNRNTELHDWLKDLKRDAIHIKELHWRWEKESKHETNQLDKDFKSVAQNIIKNTIKIQNKIGIEPETTAPTPQPTKGRKPSFKRKGSQRNRQQQSEKNSTTRGNQPLSCDEFHDLLKSLKADSIALKKLYKERKSPADDQGFRTCAGRITYYSFQLQNKLGLAEPSRPHDRPPDSYKEYLDMERGQKRKRTSNSPDAPDIGFHQRTTGSQTCAQCEHYKQEADRYYKRCQDAKATDEELRRSVNQLQNQLATERKAKDEALTRLAAEAGRKIFDNNPDITDLSDPNRPKKLAEQMSELYDNEWTNALENLIGKRMTEEQGVKYLLNTLTEVYLFCEEAANKQFSGVLKHVVVPERALQYSSKTEMGLSAPPEDLIKIMKDYRKKNWIDAVPLLQKAFNEQKHSDTMMSSCKDYVDKCMKLCWLMKIQDPPVYMEWNYRNGDPFNTNLFRTYTKMGNAIDFVVWPILYLHKNGSLLGKGIAQGMKTEQMPIPRQGTVI